MSRLVRAALDALPHDRPNDWSVRLDGPWCVMFPPGHVPRKQGWKLHLSATPGAMTELLRRAIPVLADSRCSFKFAATAERVGWLNSARCPRAEAGKALTAYPNDDEQFRRLVTALDRATAGLPGPQILSDRQYRPGSVVHYRFGGFTDERTLDDDGYYRPMIVDPTGQAIPDVRHPWFSPPEWAVPPLPDQPVGRPVNGTGPVLLRDRFLIHAALRHSSRGGVFLGNDRQTGEPVVVKQARAHMEVDPAGRDCRDRMRHEAEILDLLAPAGLTPRPILLTEEAEDLFLVRQHVEGKTLRGWVADHQVAGGVPYAAGISMARALVRLVHTVHGHGLVLVDVSPNNIMVDSGSALWLTDVDHVVRAGEVIHPAGTAGYIPPEHLAGGDGVTACPQADLFGLGALLFLLATGADPVLLDDDVPGRTVPERLRIWLDAARGDQPLIARFRDAVVELTSVQPDNRGSTRQILRLLDRGAGRAYAARRTAAARSVPPATERDVDRLIEDGVAHLLAEMAPDGRRLWPSGPPGADADPCAVQHGAAGVLAVLVRATPRVVDPDQVHDAVAVACRWIEDRVPAEPVVLPGLYFGRSGTAWALHDAAALLGDRSLAGTALRLAKAVPVEWPNPDIAHGVAGAGTAMLHLWRATRDPFLAAQVSAGADRLLAGAERTPAAVVWPIPATLRSTLAGRTFYGYAHGTAGIGQFLLAAGTFTGHPEYTALALAAADTVVDAAQLVDHAAFWPAMPAEPAHADTGWCKGSAGTGGFLLRAWRVSGRHQYLDLAKAAARAVYRTRLRSSLTACHGLAGGGQYLLDMADAPGDARYRRWAWQLAEVMVARSARRGGRLLLPDESGEEVTADYSLGLAGPIDFLLRLRHGGVRPWTVEP